MKIQIWNAKRSIPYSPRAIRRQIMRQIRQAAKVSR